MADPAAAQASHESTPQPPADAVIDPELAALPAPSRPTSEPAQDQSMADANTKPTVPQEDANGSSSAPTTSVPYNTNTDAPASLNIAESIAQAPNPRPSDFNYTQIAEFPPSTLDDVDYDAIVNDGTPGSPTSKVMRAAVPHNAAQAEPKWGPVSNPFPQCHQKIRLDERVGGGAGGTAMLVVEIASKDVVLPTCGVALWLTILALASAQRQCQSLHR